jgi:3-isopropylmalate dehydrogenase
MRRPETREPIVIGVLPGEGIGPEIVAAGLTVLDAVQESSELTVDVRQGGAIGIEAAALHGAALSHDAITFCEDVFTDGGAVWAGAGGGRFVYDLRKRFDLFYKVSPLRVHDELVGASRFKPAHVGGVDLLLVRETLSGLYQGSWTLEGEPGNGRRATHSYDATEHDVRRVLDVAAGLAASRSGRLAVVVKRGGAPAISALWDECAVEAALVHGLNPTLLDVDFAAYHLLQHPHELDVVVAPNLLGDVLTDIGGVLLGSRGLTYGASFSATSAAVYQTNHGSAYDLAGTDRANPAGQILALALLLRESFGLRHEATLIEDALRAAWRDGWRTFDIAEAGSTVVGTREFAQRTAERVAAVASVVR